MRTELWRLSVPQEEHCRAWVPERNVSVICLLFWEKYTFGIFLKGVSGNNSFVPVLLGAHEMGARALTPHRGGRAEGVEL